MGDHARRKKGADEHGSAGEPGLAPGFEAFWAGAARGIQLPLIDPRVPGVPADPTALLPYIDRDHEADPVAMAAAVTAQLTESAKRSTAFTAAHARQVREAHTTATAIADVVGRDAVGNEDSSAKLLRLLAGKTPAQIQALRAAFREQTRGAETLDDVLDRSLDDDDRVVARAALTGDAVLAASVAIERARGDAPRLLASLRPLTPAQIASLQQRFPATTVAWMSVPVDHQAEISSLLAGRTDAARGARVADLLRDPLHGAALDGVRPDAQTTRDFEARATPNVLRELATMSPADLAKARAEWDAAAPARGEKTWDAMIEERFASGDPLTYARIRALATGNTVEATALALSQGLRDHDQATIEAALANPDLSSPDPAKRAAAREHARAVAARFQDIDRNAQVAIAAAQGHDPSTVRGTSLDTALARHYAHAAAPDLASPAAIVETAIAPDTTAARRKKRARATEVGTDELREAGVFSTATEIHRARDAGDEARVATLLEDQRDRAAVDHVEVDYARKYGDALFPRGDTAMLDAYREYQALRGTALTYEQAAYATRDSSENRVEAVRVEGPRAVRSDETQVRLDTREDAHEHSDDMAWDEFLRTQLRGRPAGAQQRRTWALASETEAVGTADFAPRAQHLRAMADTYREEKAALAERAARWISIGGKLAALVTLNPTAMLVIDALVGFASIYIKSDVLGPAYKTGGAELLDVGITALNDLAMLPILKLESTLARTATLLGLTSGTIVVRNDLEGRSAETTIDLVKNLIMMLVANPAGDKLEEALGGVRGKAVNILGNAAANGAAYGSDATTLLDAAGGHLAKKGAHHASTEHAHARPPAHAHVVANGHYAEDTDAAAPVRVVHHMHPEERARRQAYFEEHGHTGSDLHSHFMGVPTVDDFARVMGQDADDNGPPMPPEQMFQFVVDAVRNDPDYAKHYSKTATGDVVFDATGSGSDPVQGGHAFDNVYVLEEAKQKIDELRAQPPTPELDAQIREVARGALDKTFNSSQHTPYDGGYSIRDTTVKAYVDKQPQGGVAAYQRFTRMTLEALARDGVLYSEQSQSVKKLTKGNVPYEMVRDELAAFNAQRAERGEPPIDLRFLAMIETRFLGAEGAPSAGTEADWKAQLDAARNLMKRGDVMGVDFASPETSDMGKGGKQLETRFEQLALMLAEQGKAAGRMLTLRPHVGEGYIEMARDPETGGRDRFDRDHGDAHYAKARSNLDALIANVERLTKTNGPDGKPIYDPENPAFEIRFGHATHATPEQAEAMARLKIKVEVNLGSNAISGSLQDSKTHPQGRTDEGHLRSMEDHSLLTLATTQVEIHLSTDAQAVMRTEMRSEYVRAAEILNVFRGDPTTGVRGSGTVRVTREKYLAAHPELDSATAKPPYELTYDQLPADMKRNIDSAYQRMIDVSMHRQSETDRGDRVDRRREGSR